MRCGRYDFSVEVNMMLRFSKLLEVSEISLIRKEELLSLSALKIEDDGRFASVRIQHSQVLLTLSVARSFLSCATMRY